MWRAFKRVGCTVAERIRRNPSRKISGDWLRPRRGWRILPELTPTIVNEFVKKIIVYAPEKSGIIRIQKVKIIFNFLDELDIPEIGEPIVTETTYGHGKTA